MSERRENYTETKTEEKTRFFNICDVCRFEQDKYTQPREDRRNWHHIYSLGPDPSEHIRGDVCSRECFIVWATRFVGGEASYGD